MRTESDEPDEAPASGRAKTSGPLRLAVRMLLVILGIAGLIMAASLLLLAVSNAGGVLRILVAMAMAVFIAWFGIGFARQLGNPPPPDPEPVAVDPRLRLAYMCEMCGLELAVVVAAKDKAPKHCGEEMALVRKGL